jgi:hypothetical protein
MSVQSRSVRWPGAILVVLLALTTGGCDDWRDPVGPEAEVSALSSDLARLGRERVTVCHRTGDTGPYLPITVADGAVSAHLGHGDGLVGDPVPGEPGMQFDADCRPVVSRQVGSLEGRWDGTSYWFEGLFTVASTGPVDAVATISGADSTWPLRLALLGYSAGAPSPPGSCSTNWLPTELPVGPTMYPPTVTAHWDAIPPGTYCLNVVSAQPVPPYPDPYTWSVTITYPGG